MKPYSGYKVVIMNKQTIAKVFLRLMTESSASVVITDACAPDNPIVFVNPAFVRLTGYRSEDILGRNCRFLQGMDTAQPARKRIRGALLIGLECQETIRNYRSDGTSFYNRLAIFPLFDSRGRVEYFVGVQREVASGGSDG